MASTACTTRRRCPIRDVRGNIFCGIQAFGTYAYPEIAHSKIINSGYAGVGAWVDGRPVLGNISLGTGMNNSIYSNPKNVYNATSYTVMAENCWWGAIPTSAMFHGSVDYRPYLTSDPVPDLAPAKPVETPPVFALAQNYPNPFGMFSEKTRIRYAIPSSERKVVLKVYDVSGRLVRTLVDGVREADQYVATWDGRSDRGDRAAPGIYFCRLEFGSQSVTKKMVLLR